MDIETRIRALLKESEQIINIRKLANTILANGCYSEKEEKQQLDRANLLGDLTDQEARIIKKSWEFRRKKREIVMGKLEKILDEGEIGGKK